MKAIRQVVVAVVAVVVAVHAKATLLDLTFNGGSTTASGQIDVVDGVATGGFLDITSGPGAGDYSLYTWSGGGTSSVRVSGGTDLIVDNLVNVNTSPYVDFDGLAFVNTDDSEGINFSADGSSPNISGFGVDGYSVPNVDGVATLSTVPDHVPTFALLAAGMIATFVFFPKRFKRSSSLEVGTLLRRPFQAAATV